MVSPGIIARPSVCLRCQLREVLRQTRIHRRILSSSSKQRCNAFSTGLRRPQDAGEDVVVRREKLYYWKKVKTPERVIGKPGRRQRAVSERLSTDSLERPANVIVFRDVAEEPQTQPYVTATDTSIGLEPRPIALTAKDIENSITGRYIAPGEAEVNASIEELRPAETVVVEKEFEEHKQTLMKGYTFPQLSRYLHWSFQASAPGRSLPEESTFGDGVQELGSTKWHPGQTPLHERHSHVIKKAGPNTKSKLVEQILRLAWHLTVQSEEQEVGELEVRLQPWQTIMLFDILNNDLPYYQSFIRSPILLEATQIQLYRPHGVMRVTGRRQDSEEVARQLKLALLKVERLELDFGSFSKSLNKGVTQQREQLFSEEELGYVSSLTKSVIVLEGDALLAVYGISESVRHNARRLLLALLDLPTRTSFDRLLDSSRHARRKVGGTSANLMVPVDMSSGLHRRYRNGELLREVEPGRRDLVKSSPSMPEGDTIPPTPSEPNEHSAQDDNIEKISLAIVNELSKALTPWRRISSADARATSYWHRSPSLTGWKVEFVRILREEGVPPAAKQTKLLGKRTAAPTFDTGPSLVQHQVPGLQSLLSFFEPGLDPRSRDAKTPESTDRIADTATATPYLVAHFVPSPLSTRSPTRLPRLQIRFKFSPRRLDEPQELRVTGMIATIDEQQLKVPLPKHAVDMYFSRRLILGARLNIAINDQAIQELTSKLQDSAHRQGGLLEAPPELTVRLPRTLLSNDPQPTASEDFEIKYLFERFEQVQRTRFTPRQRILEKEVDEEVKSLIRTIPRDIALDYKEVEGGAIYGSRTMLGLKVLPPGILQNDIQLPAARESTANTESQLKVSVTEEQQSSPTLGTDTAGSSESLGGAEEQSQARTTHTGGEHGRAAPESTGDVQQVEQNAEPAQDSSSQMKELVSTALRFANLLTRATSGSLNHYGSQK